MKIIDTTTYFEEKMMMELRFNILSPFVDEFIVCESRYSHSGKEKDIKFNKSDFPEFENKITHLIVDKEPKNLIKKDKLNTSELRLNSIFRIKEQRNYIGNALKNFSPKDYVIYSDNDEIPNMDEFNQLQEKNKIIIFEQKLFYYKFNLLCDRIFWYGTRAVRKKDLIDFEWIRQIKPKRYPFFRADVFFKKDKFIDIKILKNGGWHFTRVLSPEKIHEKELDAEHHDEYRASKKNVNKIKDLIKRRVIDHNHLADSKEQKYGEEFKLKYYEDRYLPEYIRNNKDIYKDYLDIHF